MNELLAVIIRGFIAFLTLLIFARLLGKQQLSQLTYFDYILGITIGSTASSLTTDLATRPWPHWIGILVWVSLVIILQLATLKWRFVSKYIDGEPTIVIMNGQLLEVALKKLRFRLSDLLEELRVQGVFDLKEVEFAILETNGRLSLLKKSQYQPVTAKDLHLPTGYTGISTELIYDGVIVEENLKQVKLSRAWLDGQLKKLNIFDPGQVFLASLNSNGELFIDTYRDHIANPVKINDLSNHHE